MLGAALGLSEADTRAKLIDPAIHARGWTEDLICREETAGAIEIIDGRPFKQAKGRTDYTLRIKATLGPGWPDEFTFRLLGCEAPRLRGRRGRAD